jgi:hypothetical protein
MSIRWCHFSPSLTRWIQVHTFMPFCVRSILIISHIFAGASLRKSQSVRLFGAAPLVWEDGGKKRLVLSQILCMSVFFVRSICIVSSVVKECRVPKCILTLGPQISISSYSQAVSSLFPIVFLLIDHKPSLSQNFLQKPIRSPSSVRIFVSGTFSRTSLDCVLPSV